jgi:phosphoglycolate phosphatase-like HAD superfamily hydrolase
VSRLPFLAVLLAALLGAGCASGGAAPGPLASWHDGAARRAIVEFVGRVTDPASPDFVPEPGRIAVFDHDGTLWSESPAYFQLLFALDRVRAMAADRPEWRETEPFASLLRGDLASAAKGGERAVLEIVTATHAGLTAEEFDALVRAWIEAARHPTLGRPYRDLRYRPMLELLAYLGERGFATYIVSGGGADFIRPWAEEAYGIPPERVVGSTIGLRYEVRGGLPVLVRLPEIDFIDDGPGKPVGIHRRIGRRPILAAGNSDGDLAMLEWTAAGPGPSLCLLVRHDDAAREWAYDRASKVGRLDRALDEASSRGWTVVSMREDWRSVHVRDAAAP